MASATATTTKSDLSQDLKQLGLLNLAHGLDDLLARATRSRWSHRQMLEEIVREELQDRSRRSVERRLKRARLKRFKSMADFDWNWPKTLDRRAVERMLALDFIDRGDNVVLVGTHGLGKTMIAKNVAHEAVLKGKSALFITAADLLLDLSAQETARALEMRLRRYIQPHLLVIDELGYLAYDAHAADLLFQVISRRYEYRSVLVTTNLPFKQWDTVFPNASCAVALIDRLTHHAEVIAIDGDSYRRREASEKRDRE
jgi:DNA replication protein DnaC